MKCKILPFPNLDTNEQRIKSLTDALFDDQDYSEEILEIMLEYWGNFEEYDQFDADIYYHLRCAYEYILKQKGYELLGLNKT